MTVASPTLDTVAITTEGAIGTLTLNRPQALNAFNRQLMEDIVEAAQWFDRQKEIKVVIIEGKGRAFCAGFDMDNFDLAASAEAVRETVALGHYLSRTVSRMRATTIAAVQSHCIGGGVVLMAACDFRYAGLDARFLLPETELGIPLAWGSVPWLVREIGPLKAMEFILMCDRIDAKAALSMGMLNDVLPNDRLHDHVRAVAIRLCERSKLVLEATKQQVLAARDELAGNAYSFCDAHLLHSALLDKESIQSRLNYIEKISRRNTVNAG